MTRCRARLLIAFFLTHLNDGFAQGFCARRHFDGWVLLQVLHQIALSGDEPPFRNEPIANGHWLFGERRQQRHGLVLIRDLERLAGFDPAQVDAQVLAQLSDAHSGGHVAQRSTQPAGWRAANSRMAAAAAALRDSAPSAMGMVTRWLARCEAASEGPCASLPITIADGADQSSAQYGVPLCAVASSSRRSPTRAGSSAQSASTASGRW